MPVPAYRPPTFRRTPGYRHTKRLAASFFLIFGFILLAIALGVAWWSWSLSVGGSSLTYSFLPGSSLSATCSGSICSSGVYATGTVTYAAAALGNVGTIYTGAEGLIAGGMVLGLIAAVFALLGGYGLNFGRSQLTLTVLLALIAFILTVAAVAWVTAGQPGAIPSDMGRYYSCLTGPNPSSSFWGSCSSSYEGTPYSISWGADAGWYCAVVGMVLLLVGTVLLIVTRKEPYTANEIAMVPPPTLAAPPPGPYVTAPGLIPPPAAAPTTAYPPPPPPPPSPPAAGPWVPCPTCNAMNQVGSSTCWQCHRPLS